MIWLLSPLKHHPFENKLPGLYGTAVPLSIQTGALTRPPWLSWETPSDHMEHSFEHSMWLSSLHALKELFPWWETGDFISNFKGGDPH
jgi:hypothetical protein